jgi:molybdate transport system ATP-binding protein
MNQNHHIGIVIRREVDKNLFVEKLLSNNTINHFTFLPHKKRVLFSDVAIEKIIQEEYKHDTIIVAEENNRKLQTFSSGEKKKIFLEYCRNQNPDYLILDNALDHLDTQSRVAIWLELEEISKSTIIIQIADRESDILDFINQKYQINPNTFQIETLDKLNKKEKSTLEITIPKPNSFVEFDNEILVEFKSVSLQYQTLKILDNISWTIKKNEFWQLIGPNGSGKSTILSLINGDNPKGYGQELYLFGQKKGSGESIWDIKKKIGYFNPTMTDLFNGNHSLENMILSGFFDSIGLYVQPTDLQLKIAEEWIIIIGLMHLRKKSFSTLSTMQKRLVLIVRAFIKNPLLLILDEPIDGLDEESTLLVAKLINKIHSETKIAIIYVSHCYEPRIKPMKIYELIPSQNGSRGKIKEF